MSFFIARIIAYLITILMFCFSFNPLLFAGFYIIFRPTVQPFAYLKYTLFGNFPLTSLFALALICYAIIDCTRKGCKFFPKNIIPLYLLCFYSTLSFYNTPDLNLSIGHLLKIATAISMYLLIYNNIRCIADIKKIYICYFLSAIIPLAFGLYQYVTKTGHAWEVGPGSARIDSVLGECNAYGEYLTVIICVILASFYYEKFKFKKWLLVLLSIPVAVSFILSLNRGSWLGLTIGIIVASFWYKRHIKVSYIILAFTGILIIAIPIVIDRFLDLNVKTEYGSRNTFTGRINYFSELIPLVKRNPFIGYGLGTAGYSSLITYPPHNDYLRIALEAGIPGSLMYILFLFNEFFNHITREKNTSIGSIHFSSLVLVVYFIILSFFQNIIYNITVFPMILGIFAISAKIDFLEKTKQLLSQSKNAHTSSRISPI